MNADTSVGLSKRVSLSEFSDGWDKCYAIVRPADMDELLDMSDVDFSNMNTRERIEKQLEFISSHFISGRIMNGQNELRDMRAEDAKASPLIIKKLFNEVMGLSLDPKETATADPSTPQSLPATSEPNSSESSLN
jgi:hypothetical protein